MDPFSLNKNSTAKITMIVQFIYESRCCEAEPNLPQPQTRCVSKYTESVTKVTSPKLLSFLSSCLVMPNPFPKSDLSGRLLPLGVHANQTADGPCKTHDAVIQVDPTKRRVGHSQIAEVGDQLQLAGGALPAASC